MSKSIPPELQALINVSFESNNYENADDLMKATHTQLENPETQKAVRDAWLKRQLERIEAEGGGKSFEEVCDRLELRALDRLET